MLYLLVLTVLVVVAVGAESGPPCASQQFAAQLRSTLQRHMIAPQQAHDVTSRAVRDVSATLNRRWQGYELYTYGSLGNGLATQDSDVDVYVGLRDYNTSAEANVLEQAKNLFMEQPTVYSNVTVVIHPSLSFVSVAHKPLQRRIDILFKGAMQGVRNTNLTRYYVHLDERFWPLTSILKLWLINRMPPVGDEAPFPSYSIYLLVIFYLQQKKLVPSGFELQRNSASYFVDGWDMGYNELQYNTTSPEDVYELLAGFFDYYSEFRFDEYIVSPFAGRPIRRNAFEDISRFPVEYSYESIHNETLRNKNRLRLKYNLDVDTDLCIQDIFYHEKNILKHVTCDVTHEHAMRFVNLIRATAEMFKTMSRDNILGAMLGADIVTHTGLSGSCVRTVPKPSK